jgi:predicted phosphoribosyltransferase
VRSSPLFRDRRDAGRRLAAALRPQVSAPATVLALPRGGLPIADEIARELDLPLDVLDVRKLGVPGHEELAMGAIAAGGALVINDDVVAELGIRPEVLDEVLEQRRAELAEREPLLRAGRPPLELRGRAAVLVDDGLATGATMRAAILAADRLGASRTIVAVPVAAADTADALRAEADVVVCLATPEPFRGVGVWYGSFPQLGDAEVRAILARDSGT